MTKATQKAKKMLPSPSEIIDALGGPSAVAGLVGIKPPSVCEWREKTRIPEASLNRLAPHIEKVMGIPKHITCPDVFEAPVKSKKVKVA